MKRILSLLFSAFCLLMMTSCVSMSQGNYILYNIENISTKISDTMQAYLNDHSKAFVKDNLYNITPKKLSRICEIYKENVNDETYLVYKKKTYLLGNSFGGHGVTQFAYYRSVHQKRLYYIYSFGSGIHRSDIEYFDFDTQEIQKPLIANADKIFLNKDIEFDIKVQEDVEILNVYESNYSFIDDFHIQMTKKNILCEDIGKLLSINKNEFTIEAWKNATYEQRGKMIDSFLNLYDIKKFDQNDIEKYLSTPNETSKIMLECDPPIYNGMTYIYYLSDINKNDQRKYLEIVFNTNNRVTSYSIFNTNEQPETSEDIEMSEGHGYNGANHSLILKESQPSTCQKEGYEVLGCASCDWIYGETYLPVVPCKFIEGICKWCGGKESDYDYQMYNVNIIGDIEFLIDTYDGQYPSGTIFEVKTDKLYDAGIDVYVNQKKIERTHSKDYWGYAFMMPSEDITIEIMVVSWKDKNEECLL